MSDSFVDLSYRGLPLARRVKLTQVRPSSGYVEMPTPMPVGTKVAIATEEGVAIDAVVAEIHEQVGGAMHVPGMLVKPALDGAGASWWETRVTAADPAPQKPPPIDPEELRRTDPMVPTTIVGKRQMRSGDGFAGDAAVMAEIAVPEAVDDGHNTAVTEVPILDDGKATTMMDAVDLEALGLDPNARPSGEITAVSPPLDDEPKSPTNAAKKKRKKR